MKYFISFILLLFFCGCEPYFMKYAAKCAGTDDKSAQKNMYWFKDRHKYSFFMRENIEPMHPKMKMMF